MSLAVQFVDEVRADKPRCTCDKTLHFKSVVSKWAACGELSSSLQRFELTSDLQLSEKIPGLATLEQPHNVPRHGLCFGHNTESYG
jgi:hypothetical protein